MEIFAEIVNDFEPLTISGKSLCTNHWENRLTSEIYVANFWNVINKETLAQVFSLHFAVFFRKIFLAVHIRETVSKYATLQIQITNEAIGD